MGLRMTWPTSCPARSEEHTSELQSQSNLVCRLLLEKKKKPSQQNHNVPVSRHSHMLTHTHTMLLRSHTCILHKSVSNTTLTSSAAQALRTHRCALR